MKLSRLLLVAAGMLPVALAMRADFPAAKALRTAPPEISLPVSPTSFSQLIDFASEGAVNHVGSNIMHGDASISELDSLHARFSTGNSRSMDLYVLPVGKGDTLLAVIETLQTSAAPDSRLRLYDSSWAPLTDKRRWREPGLTEWLTPDGVRKRADVEQAVSFLLTSYRYDPVSKILTLTNMTDSVLSPEQQRIAAGALRHELRYVWTSKGFKPAK